jgi:hypothetical protein
LDDEAWMERAAGRVVADVGAFSRAAMAGYALRGYQLEPARAIVESVRLGLGRSFAIAFSRQAGKDELLAQTLAFLLLTRQGRGGAAVVAAPTFRPQAALARDRLRRRLALPEARALARLLAAAGVGAAGAEVGGDGRARVRDGYVVEVGKASARFLSAAPAANPRGQTADLLLVANEAQDIPPDTWDAVFDPMGAASNATTVFLGTVWTRETLLARQMAALDAQEARDGVRRVWRVDWEAVAADVPAYGDRVRARIAQFGIAHPFVRTEYLLRELDEAGGLFSPARVAQLQGDHPRRRRAAPDARYALLVDVAGEEESAPALGVWRPHARRDSTAVTVVEVGESASRQVGKDEGVAGAELGPDDTDGTARLGGVDLPCRLADSPTCRLPRYRVVDRMAWTGVAHAALHRQLVDLATAVWGAGAVVVDATGVGAGLASFLAAALGGRAGWGAGGGGGGGAGGGGGGGGGRPGRAAPLVVPFQFSAASKSALGWELLALIDGGRLKEYAPDGEATTREFWRQLGLVAYETPPGPGHPLRWGVPAARGHDDLVMSLALVSVLDGLDWGERVAVGT